MANCAPQGLVWGIRTEGPKVTNTELWTVLHEGRDTIAPVDPPSDRDLIEILAWGIIELRSESEEASIRTGSAPVASGLSGFRRRRDCEEMTCWP